jgi:hypothetical protein
VTFARWCDDVEAVVAAAQVVGPVLVGSLTALVVELIDCDRHPDDMISAVLINQNADSIRSRHSARPAAGRS